MSTAQRQLANVESPLQNRSRSVWQRLPGGFNAPFLPAEMKDDIAETGTVFTVNSITYREQSTYGPVWFVNIELGGQMFTIPFGAADYRNDLMIAVQDALLEGPFDATLVAFDTPAGHGWNLAEPDYDHDGTALPE